VKLTDTPAYCASCYAQKPAQRHVDLEAAYDGPVLEGSVRVAIDDLVLCEECLTEAANLIGLVNPDETTAELDRARERLAQQDERLLAQSAYVAQLEAAVAAKPKPPAKPRAKAAA
jgi:hypothetical protein